MLKVCWDCLVGNRIDDNDAAYDARVNRDTSNAWHPSQLQSENMFRLPRPLKVGETITINTTIPSSFTGRLLVNLTTDYQKPVCQFEANLANHDEPVILNGKPDENFTVYELFAGKNEVSLKFNVVNYTVIDVDVDTTAVGSFEIVQSLSDITFLTLNEEIKVKDLQFKFT